MDNTPETTTGQSDDEDTDSEQEEGKDKSQFFRHPVFLTVSGQLHLEAMAR